jgi:hypothetical protein
MVQHFPITPYGGIFQLYLNSTPIAELSVETAAELTPTTGSNIWLPTGDKMPPRIKSWFGILKRGAEAPDAAIEWILHLKWQNTDYIKAF